MELQSAEHDTGSAAGFNGALFGTGLWAGSPVVRIEILNDDPDGDDDEEVDESESETEVESDTVLDDEEDDADDDGEECLAGDSCTGCEICDPDQDE